MHLCEQHNERFMDASELADLLLSHLEAVLGPNVFDALIFWMANEYFGEMGVKTAIAKRPDLFERAFIHALGEAGKHILRNICTAMHTKYTLEGMPYFKEGDLAAYIKTSAKS